MPHATLCPSLVCAAPRVFLVDDSDHLRQGLRALLEDAGMTVVGEALSADMAAPLIPIATQTDPLVALIDVRMPGVRNGIDLTRLLTISGIPVAAIVLTASAEAGIERAATEAGAVAFLLKGTPPDTIVTAIRDAWALVGQEVERAPLRQ
jgi:two-component system response regulator DesR